VVWEGAEMTRLKVVAMGYWLGQNTYCEYVFQVDASKVVFVCVCYIPQ